MMLGVRSKLRKTWLEDTFSNLPLNVLFFVIQILLFLIKKELNLNNVSLPSSCKNNINTERLPHPLIRPSVLCLLFTMLDFSS